MVQDYRIQMRFGFGKEIGKNAKGRKITVYTEEYKTKAGRLEPHIWREKIIAEIEQAGEKEALEIIKEHCRNSCAWLHKEEEITDHAMEILAGRTFLCGRENWKEVEEKILEKYFIDIHEENWLLVKIQ